MIISLKRKYKTLSPNTTHNLSQSNTYKTWSRLKFKMKRGCVNKDRVLKTRNCWHCSRGRVLEMDYEWRLFSNFFKDMGACPPNHVLRRKSDLVKYDKNNCYWAMKKDKYDNKN